MLNVRGLQYCFYLFFVYHLHPGFCLEDGLDTRQCCKLVGVRSLVVERRTAERAAGVRFPTCVPLARIQNRYGIPTGQFGSCPISIWRPGVLGLSSPGT